MKDKNLKKISVFISFYFKYDVCIFLLLFVVYVKFSSYVFDMKRFIRPYLKDS